MEMSKDMDQSKKLPFWLRRVDRSVRGQAAAIQTIEFNWTLVLTWIVIALVVTGGITHIVYRFQEASTENQQSEIALKECLSVVGIKAKDLASHQGGMKWTAVGRIERLIDRQDKQVSFNCNARVKFDIGGTIVDTEDWIVMGQAGTPLVLASARFFGEDQAP